MPALPRYDENMNMTIMAGHVQSSAGASMKWKLVNIEDSDSDDDY